MEMSSCSDLTYKMSETSILFPNLGITLRHVGRTISINGFEIAYYGMIIAVGMMLGIGLILFIARRKGENEDLYFDLTFITIICSVAGARIYYVLFSWKDYRDNLLEIFNIRGGGLAIYGGVLTGIITVWIFARRKKLRFLRIADILCPGLVVGQMLGRWGNFFNREAFGKYCDGIFAMALPRAAVRQDEITAQMLEHIQIVDGMEFIQVHPTFLYESLWNLCVLGILLWVSKREHFDGKVFFLYLLCYGSGRFWIESLRTDQLLLFGTGVPVSQLISGILVIAALVGLLSGNWHGVRRKGEANE